MGAPDERLACERCDGFYSIDLSPNGAEPRVRCNACGHIRETLGRQDEGHDGKWTLIGPDGKVMTYASWNKLVESGHPSTPPPSSVGSASRRTSTLKPDRSSATALLDVTPMPALPRLALADLGSDPDLVASPEPPSTPLGNDDEDAAPISLRDVVEDSNEEPMPLSLRDVTVENVEPPASSREVLSMKDFVAIIPPADDSAVDSTPPPPARGVLRTLPPTASTAPPPTITVEDSPASKKIDEKPARESNPSSAAATAARTTISKNGTTDPRHARRPIASAKAAAADDEPKRGWVVPSLVVVGLTTILWRTMAASPGTPAPDPPPPVAETPTPAATEATAESEPTDVAASHAATSATSPTATTTSPARTSAGSTTEKKVRASSPSETDTPAPVEKKATARESGPSMSDLLDQAGSARRSGDHATARDLYERVLRLNPNNVEANGGLGDVARAQGNLALAKTSYERALAASPVYGPAQLGLADTEWDLGNRAGAQRRYAQVVERLGDRAPERAKQRGVVME